MVALPK